MTQKKTMDELLSELGGTLDNQIVEETLLSTEGFMREPVGAAVDRVNALQEELRLRLRNGRMVAIHTHDVERDNVRRQFEYDLNEAMTRLERERDQKYRALTDRYFQQIKEIEAAEARLP